MQSDKNQSKKSTKNTPIHEEGNIESIIEETNSSMIGNYEGLSGSSDVLNHLFDATIIEKSSELQCIQVEIFIFFIIMPIFF